MNGKTSAWVYLDSGTRILCSKRSEDGVAGSKRGNLQFLKGRFQKQAHVCVCSLVGWMVDGTTFHSQSKSIPHNSCNKPALNFLSNFHTFWFVRILGEVLGEDGNWGVGVTFNL